MPNKFLPLAEELPRQVMHGPPTEAEDAFMTAFFESFITGANDACEREMRNHYHHIGILPVRIQ